MIKSQFNIKFPDATQACIVHSIPNNNVSIGNYSGAIEKQRHSKSLALKMKIRISTLWLAFNGLMLLANRQNLQIYFKK